MTSDSEPDPSTRRRRAIADSLRQYLSDATSMPPAPTPEPDDSIGWFAPAPGGHKLYGREPWTRMRDVEVGVAGHAVAVSFTWRPTTTRRGRTWPCSTRAGTRPSWS
ncbi:hypothetical protein GTA09_00040 [Rhodococcus hoagii]|nr:hypothetical protein [Prescottella equi]